MHRRIMVLVSGGVSLAALLTVMTLVVVGTDAAPRGTVTLISAVAVLAGNVSIVVWATDVHALGVAFWAAQQRNRAR
jgi:hypothetical protein